MSKKSKSTISEKNSLGKLNNVNRDKNNVKLPSDGMSNNANTGELSLSSSSVDAIVGGLSGFLNTIINQNKETISGLELFLSNSVELTDSIQNITDVIDKLAIGCDVLNDTLYNIYIDKQSALPHKSTSDTSTVLGNSDVKQIKQLIANIDGGQRSPDAGIKYTNDLLFDIGTGIYSLVSLFYGSSVKPTVSNIKETQPKLDSKSFVYEIIGTQNPVTRTNGINLPEQLKVDVDPSSNLYKLIQSCIGANKESVLSRNVKQDNQVHNTKQEADLSRSVIGIDFSSIIETIKSLESTKLDTNAIKSSLDDFINIYITLKDKLVPLSTDTMNSIVTGMSQISQVFDWYNHAAKSVNLKDMTELYALVNLISEKDGLNDQLYNIISNIDDLSKMITDLFATLTLPDMHETDVVNTDLLKARIHDIQEVNNLLINLITGEPSLISLSKLSSGINMDGLKHMLDDVSTVLTVIGMFDPTILKRAGSNIAQLEPAIDSIYKLVSLIDTNNKEVNLDAIKGLVALIDGLESIQLDQVIGKLDTIKTVTSGINVVLLSVAPVAGIGIFANIGLRFAERSIKYINNIINELSALDTKQLNELSNEKIIGLRRIITGFSATLLAASSLAITALPAFLGITLANKVLNGIIIAVNSLNSVDSKDIRDSQARTKDVTNIVVAIGGLMLGGAIIGIAVLKFVPQLLAFLGAFSLFTIAIIGSLRLITHGMTVNAMKTLSGLGSVVMVMSGLMMFAALTGDIIFKQTPQILGFAITFSLFNLFIIGALNVATSKNGLKGIIGTAKDLMLVVTLSSAVMLFGGMIIAENPGLIVGSLVFAGVLSVFLFGVSFALSHGGRQLRGCMKELVMITAVEIVTAGIMLFAANMMRNDPGLVVYLGLFVSAFMGLTMGISYILKSLSRMGSAQLAKGTIALGAMSLLIGSMGASMLLFAKTAKEIDSFGDFAKLIGVIGLGVSMIGGLTLIARTLSVATPQLVVGVGSIALVTLLSTGIAGSMFVWTNLADRIPDMSRLLQTVGIAGSIITALGVLSAGAGLAAGVILVGVGVIGTVTLLSIGIAGMLNVWNDISNKIADPARLFESVRTASTLFEGIGLIAVQSFKMYPKLVLGMGSIGLLSLFTVSIGKALQYFSASISKLSGTSNSTDVIRNQVLPMFDTLPVMLNKLTGSFDVKTIIKLPFILSNIEKLGEVVSVIASAVAESASMHYTKYENGRKVGEFNLQPEDFTKATTNTQQVVSVLGGAIIDIYNKRPDIFDTGTLLTDISGGRTRFERVVGSVQQLGHAISLIASGVANMADLHYTKYINGKAVGEFNLSDVDFERAASNTSLVITTLAEAVINTYDNNPELFSSSTTLGEMFNSDTKFSRIVKSFSGLGNMISQIARGVSDFAGGSITVFGPDGKERKQNIAEIDLAALNANVELIIMSLSNAIISVYDSHPEMFSGASKITDFFGDDTKFSKVVQSVTGLGTMMSELSKGLVDMANGKIASYDPKTGKVIGYTNINSEIATKAGTNVMLITSTLGNALMSVYDAHPDWFEGKWWTFGESSTNNKFVDTVQTVSKLGELVSGFAKAISDIANGSYVIYDQNGKERGRINLGPADFLKAGKAVGSVITLLASYIEHAASQNKILFGDDDDKVKQIFSTLSTIKKVVSDYGRTVRDFAALSFDIYDDNGVKKGKQSLTQDIIKQTGTNIELLMTSVVTALYNIYNKKEYSELLASTNPKQAPIILSMTAGLEAAMQVVSLAGKHVTDFMNRKVYKYGPDGKVIGIETLGSTDTSKVGQQIQQVLTGIVGGVAETYNQNKALFDAAEEASGLFGSLSDLTGIKSDNPFVKIMKSFSGAGELVYYASEAAVNVLNIKDFDAVKKSIKPRIEEVLVSLVQAMYDVTTKHAELFNDNNNIYNNITASIGSLSTTLKTVINIYNEIGTAIASNNSMYEAVTGLKQGESYDKNKSRIYQMIASLADPIIDIYQGEGSANYAFMFNTEQGADNLFVRIGKSVSGINELISKTSGTYNNIAKLDVDISGTGKKIHDMISGLANPILEIGRDDALHTLFDEIWSIKGWLGGLFGDNTPKNQFTVIVNSIQSITKLVDPLMKAYMTVANANLDESSRDAITNRLHHALMSFPSAINAINMDVLESADDKLSDVHSFYENVSGSDGLFAHVFNIYNEFRKTGYDSQKVISLHNRILGKMISGTVEILSDESHYPFLSVGNIAIANSKVDALIDLFNKTTVMTQKLSSLYINIKSTLIATAEDTGTDHLSALRKIINDTTEVVTLIAGLNNVMSGQSGQSVQPIVMTGITNPEFDLSNLNASVDAFADATNKVYNIYNNIPSVNKDTEYFIAHLRTLQNEIGNVPHLDQFVQETNNLVRFNDSINGLQTKNLVLLTELFVEFNRFTTKFGNLDKLTDALANKLTIALNYLSKQIKESATTIDKADRIQEKRQQQIRKTIDEFRKLATEGLEVTVKQDQSDLMGGSSGSFVSSDGATVHDTPKSGTGSYSVGVGHGSYNNKSIIENISQNVAKIAQQLRR